MVDDEPALWASIPLAQRNRVLIAAKAMCNHPDSADDEPCTCDTDGGSCIAFGLYGGMAFAAVKALDGQAGEVKK